ncbi:MAG: PDZ domain-containing protein [Clostridiales bacterium]|nr:PDZ domain-containing protein [Clostridiales bacterium]
MRKQAIAIVLGLWLLVAGAVFLHAGIPAPPDKAVTRMAELGLVLLDGEEGVSVLAVRNRSTADRAGILPGDVLLQADGIAFADILQLESVLQAAHQSMQLRLQRHHNQLITVRLSVH